MAYGDAGSVQMALAIRETAGEPGRPGAPTPLTIANLPLGLFGAPMGVLGLGLCWRQAAFAPVWIGELILLLGALSFAAQVIGYGCKLRHHRGNVRQDLRHPVQASFCGAAAIDVTLLGVALQPYAPSPAHLLWSFGAVLQLAVAGWLIQRWMREPPPWVVVCPPMLIPTIGTLVIPATSGAFGVPILAWVGATVGGLCAFVGLPIMLWRLARREALPPTLQPTLVILVTPPALGALSFEALAPTMVWPAFALLYLGVGIGVVLASRIRHFLRLPYSPAWWAYTFPLANLALAGLRGHAAVGWPLLAIVSMVVAIVAIRTLGKFVAGTLD